MPLAFPPVSRRRLLRQFGLLLGCYLRPPALLAQTAADQPDDGFRILRARQNAPSTAAQERTPVWTYDGSWPGPLLRVRRGEELKIRLVNELPEPTAIHWHGMRLPNGMDGAPPLTQPPVEPGASFNYRFTPPDAGTFWYHAHSPAQRMRGLAGALIVDETEPLEVVQEFTLIFQDAPPEPASSAQSANERIRINGAAAVDIPVGTGRLRLRLVNASLQLLRSIGIGTLSCWVMAIDGEPAQPFMARDSQVALGPGNRIDLFVDVAGELATIPIVLRDTADKPHEIARLIVRPSGGVAQVSDPRPLPANPLPERMDFRGALKTDVALGTATDEPGARPPLFSIARGHTAMLALANRTDRPQAVHLHGHHFRLLDRLDDGWKPFWLDTVLVPARETQRVAFVADAVGKWLIDGHATAATEATPAGWFEVR
jgi:FtsP/CotA-like multicopper oxidase with cupredoxin domain